MSKGKPELGQVFTPAHIVASMLDRIGYEGEKTLQRTLLEPSCGEGAFLVEAARRLIAAAKDAGVSKEGIADLLSTNLHGIDYDQDVLDGAKVALDAVAAQEAIHDVQWRLDQADALSFEADGKYDYVVGNPPYIRIHNMNEELRAQVRQFSSANGTTDLYVIFYELGMQWLKDNGVLAYITPNSWMKNASQKKFRKSLVEGRHIREIINYGATPVFGTDAATYTAITILDKDGTSPAIDYTEFNGDAVWGTQKCYAKFTSYQGEPFVFANPSDTIFLDLIESSPSRLGDLCTIQNGVATLRDSIFLGATSSIEKGITRPVVKASTYKGEATERRIIFPYLPRDSGGIRGMTEGELSQFPQTLAYLEQHKEELITRDSDASALWFHYGRSQGLANTDKRKLVFSHVVRPGQESIKCFILPEDVVVYSGLFITEKTPGLTLEEVKEALESADFCHYIRLTGKDMSGGYKSFGAKQVKTFGLIAEMQ